MCSAGPHVKSASPAQLGFCEVTERLNTTKARATVLSWGCFVPREHLQYLETFFSLLELEGRCQWHLVRRGQGGIRQCTGQPLRQRMIWPQISRVLRLENSGVGISTFPLSSHPTPLHPTRHLSALQWSPKFNSYDSSSLDHKPSQSGSQFLSS